MDAGGSGSATGRLPAVCRGIRFLLKRHSRIRTRKNSIVPAAKCLMQLEKRCQPAFGEHTKGIAANGLGFSGFEHMMLIEHQALRMMWNGAQITNRLTVIFPTGLQSGAA